MVNIWGPALLVCFTIVIGSITSNKRLGRIESLEKRLVDRLS